MQRPPTTAPARIAPRILIPLRAPASDAQLRTRSGIMKKNVPSAKPQRNPSQDGGRHNPVAEDISVCRATFIECVLGTSFTGAVSQDLQR
jgi:hypothetical protein